MSALLSLNLLPSDEKARIAALMRARAANVERTRLWTLRNKARWSGVETRLRRMIYTSRARAAATGLPHTIDVADLSVPTTCPVLGITIAWSQQYATPNSPSIDRIRPELGYVPGNIRVISNRANTLKNNATVAEMRAILADLERIEGAN